MEEYRRPKRGTEPKDRHEPGTWQPEPTPTSLRREAEERARRVPAPAEREGRRPVAALPPRPAPAHRELTPEELRQVQELSRAGLVLTAEENQAHKRR
jgi:hypothetical protein